MQLKDGFNITVSVIERMREVFSILPDDERSGCALCNEKLTNVVKRIEAEAQVSNREACRFVGAEIGKSENTVKGRVARETQKLSARNLIRDTEGYSTNRCGIVNNAPGHIYFARKYRDDVFKIGLTQSSPSKRIKQLNGYGENTWEIIKSVVFPAISNIKKIEKLVHDEFSKFRVSGEFFENRCLKAAVSFTEDLAKELFDEVKKATGSPRPKNGSKGQPLSIVDKVAQKVGTNSNKTGTVSQRQAINQVAAESGKTEASVKKAFQREQKKYAEKQTFNRTNDSAIEWAKYTWNPVTGCKHGCKYCYARGIAERKMGAYKDIGFAPHLHEERLLATENLPSNVKDEDKFCFVVSMGDLFGEWVPKEWIDKVMDAIRKAPDWTFLLLTKNPGRYAELGADYFPLNCWLGASGGTSDLVNAATEAWEEMDGCGDGHVTFLSCEPLSEEISFTFTTPDYGSDREIIHSCVDWVIVGAQSNPEKQPDPEWVKSIISQCYETGTKLYFKPNLVFKPKEKPEATQ